MQAINVVFRVQIPAAIPLDEAIVQIQEDGDMYDAGDFIDAGIQPRLNDVSFVISAVNARRIGGRTLEVTVTLGVSNPRHRPDTALSRHIRKAFEEGYCASEPINDWNPLLRAIEF